MGIININIFKFFKKLNVTRLIALILIAGLFNMILQPVISHAADGGTYDAFISEEFNQDEEQLMENYESLFQYEDAGVILNDDVVHKPGDVNMDGLIDLSDAIKVLRYIVGLVELTPEQILLADVSGSGSVNVSDAILILRYIAGLIDSFPYTVILASLTLSGSPDLIYSGADFSLDLNDLALAGTDQFGDPYDISGETVTWSVVSGSAAMDADGHTLTISNSGTVTVNAAAHGVTSNNLELTVEAIPDDPIQEYTVTFRAYDGTILKEETMSHGASATAPSDPDREGYTFTGWDTDFTDVTADLTVTAQYTINQYTVTFDSTGGSQVPDQTLDYDSTLSELPVPAREGYNFASWNTRADGDGSVFTADTPVSAHITVYAQWTAAAATLESIAVTTMPAKTTYFTGETLDLGGLVVTGTYSDNSTVPLAITMAHISGFDSSAVATGQVVTVTYEGKTTTFNIDIVAIQEYTVTYKDYDGTILKEETVSHGNGATAPADPAREGYTFSGWDKDFTNVTADLTVTALYEINNYTVTFRDWDEAELKTEIVAHGSSATAPAAPEREGYTFIGWDIDFSNVTAHLTVTAQWELTRISTEAELTAALSDSGETTIILADVTFTGDFSANVAGQTPVGAGIGSTIINGNLIVAADNITIKNLTVTGTVIIAEGVETFTAEGTDFNELVIDGGSSDSIHLESVLLDYLSINNPGVRVELKGNSIVEMLELNAQGARLELKDHTSVGWLIVYAVNSMLARGTNAVIEDLLKYHFGDFVEIEMVRVTYGVQAGEGEGSIVAMVDGMPICSGDEIGVDKEVSFTATPAAGYKVKHWIVNGNPVSLAGATYTITDLQLPVDVKVEFEKIPDDPYTVTFRDYDDKVLKVENVEYGNSATALADPAREGYTFTGWDKDYHYISTDLIVTAQYTVNEYTVTFVNWDGTVLKVETIEHGNVATAPGVSERESHTFTGWDTDFSNVTTQLTVTAQWELNRISTEAELTAALNDSSITTIYLAGGTFTGDFSVTVAGQTIVGSGKYNTRIMPGSLTVTADNIIIKDLQVDGTVTIAEGVDTFTAERASFNSLIINGGGSNSIHLESVSVNQLDINIPGARIEIRGSSSVYILSLNAPGARLELKDQTRVDWLNIYADNVIIARGTESLVEEIVDMGWYDEVALIRVTFGIQAGEGSITAMVDGKPILSVDEIDRGKQVSFTATPDFGYKVKRWIVNGNLVSFTGSTYTVTNLQAPVDVKVEFEKIPTDLNYTVIFKGYDGTILKEDTVEYGGTAMAPDDPEREGYTFTGWDQAFHFISSDLEIIAQYSIKQYTVTFMDYDGTVKKVETVNHGSSATPPLVPGGVGATIFVGWDLDFSNITEDLTVTPQYELRKYTVTFTDYDGTVLKTEIVEHGSDATAPNVVPEREGYTFTGWSYSLTNINGDLIITAIYQINWYLVTFWNYNGFIQNTHVTHGNSATATADPTREGYTFIGWDKDFTNVTGHLSVTAQYEINSYTVTFVDWDGTELKIETVEFGSGATAPPAPVREGYTFIGWDKWFWYIKQDLTITAQYNTSDYLVTFLDFDGTALKNESVEHGGSASAPPAPYRMGNTFIGWDKDFDNVTGDLTVIAQYNTSDYTVTFVDFDGTFLKTESVEYLDDATPPDDPVRVGYTFIGWDREFWGIRHDLMVTAEYEISKYTVIFKDHNDTILKEEIVEHGASAAAPAEPAREGHTFTGWDVVLDNVTSNLTITAQYSINQYTVFFNSSHGSSVPNQELNYGSKIIEPPPPTFEGYTFVGWYKQWPYVDQNLWVFDQDTVPAANVTLYGRWVINNYTLTYRAGSNGNVSRPSLQTVSHGFSGNSVTAEPDAGYHFVIWSDGVTANPRTDTQVTADITVIAEFAINEYTVTFKNHEGSVLKTETIIHGSAATAPALSEREGYIFTGWDKAFNHVTNNLTVVTQYEAIDYTLAINYQYEDGTEAAAPHEETLNIGDVYYTTSPLIDNYTAGQVVVSGEMPAGNVSITVIYTINQYTLTYEGGPNGSLGGDTSQTVSHGSTGTLVEAIPMDGYHFVRWSDGVTANPRTDTNVTVGISVTAEFAINQYTLTYTAGAKGSIAGDTAQTIIHGSSGTEVIAIPDDGYHFVRWSDGVTANPRTDINASVSVTAEFAINQYTLTYTAGSNGSIVGDTLQTVNHGSTGTSVEAVPETNYYFVRWSDGVTANPRTDIDVTGGLSVTAEFALNIHTLTYTAGANGAIIGFSQQTVAHGSNGTEVTAVPGVGYHFVKWSDGITTDSRTDIDVTAGISVTAEFAINQYTLTYTAGANGSVVGDTEQTITHGSNGTEITAVPGVGYHFVKWSDGVTANPRTDIDVTAGISVTAVFAINKYTLTYTAGANGAIAGDAEQTVEIGSNGTEVTAVPGVGYHFFKWSDGVTTASRTDTNITADTAVSAEFAINEYTVTFMDYDGTILKEETVTHGSSFIAPADPENSSFIGWSRPFNHITEDLTITAIYDDIDALLNDLAYLRFMKLLEDGYTDPQAVEALEEDERFELNTNIAYVFSLLQDGHLRAGPAMVSLNKEENIIIDFLRAYNQLRGTEPELSFSVIFSARETAHELRTYYEYTAEDLLYALLGTNRYGILEVMDAMVVGVTSPMAASQAADALKRYGVSFSDMARVLKNIYALSGQDAVNELRAGNFTGTEAAQVLMAEAAYNITAAEEAFQILTEAGFGLPAKVTVLKELYGKDLSATILLLNNAGYLDYGADPLVMRDRFLLLQEAYETSAVDTMNIIREEISPEYTQQLAADMFPLMLGIGFGGYSSKITGYLNMGFLLYEDVAYAFAENFIDSNHSVIGRAMGELGYDNYSRAIMYKYLYQYYGDKLAPNPILALANMRSSTFEMIDLLVRVFEWDIDTIADNLKQMEGTWWEYRLDNLLPGIEEYFELDISNIVAMMLRGGYSDNKIYTQIVYLTYNLYELDDAYETAGLVLRNGGFTAMMVADAIEKRYFGYNATIGSRYTARALVGADYSPSDSIDALYSRYSSLGLNKLYNDLYLAGFPIHQYSHLLGERFGYNAKQAAYYIAVALDIQPGYWRKRDFIAADLLEQLLNNFQLDYAEAIQIIIEMDEIHLYMGRFRLIEDISYAWYKNLEDHHLATAVLYDMDYTLDQIAAFLRYYNDNYDNNAKPETAFHHIGSTSLDTADRLRRFFNYSMNASREALWSVGYQADEIVLAMLTHYHVSDESAARDMKEKGITTSEIAAILMDIYEIDFTAMIQVLWEADFTAIEVALFLRDDPLYQYDDVQVAKTLRGAWFTGHEVADALITAYGAGSVRIAEVLMLEGVNYMPLEIAMIMRTVFGMDDAAEAVQIYIDADYSAGVIADIFHIVYRMEQLEVAQFLIDADYSLEKITRGIRIAYELEVREYIGLLRDLDFSLPEIAVSLWSMATRYTEAVSELYNYDYNLTDIVDAMRHAYTLSEVSRSDLIDLTGILAADIPPVEAAAAIYGVFEYESATDFARLLFSANLSPADIMLSLEEIWHLDLDQIFITMNWLGSEPLVLATTAGEVWEEVMAQEVSRALNVTGVSFADISSILLEVYGQDSLITAVNLAKETGVLVENAVTVIRNTFNRNLDDAVIALEEAGFPLMEAALALQNVYSVDDKTLGIALCHHWFKDDSRYLNTALFFVELELDAGEIGEILVLAEGGSPEFVQERVADLKQAGFQLLEITGALSQILPNSQLTHNINNVANALKDSYTFEESIFALAETFGSNWNNIFAALRGDEPQTALEALILYPETAHGDIAAIMFADGYWSVSDIALLLKEEYELDAGAAISVIETAGYADAAGSTERAAYYAEEVIKEVFGYQDIYEIIGLLKGEGFAAPDVAEWLKTYMEITSLDERLEVLDGSGYTIYDLMEVFQSSGLSQVDMLISMLNLYPLMDVIISMITYLNLSDGELTQLLIDAQANEGDIDEALAQLEELDIVLTIAIMKKEAGANAFEMLSFLIGNPVNMRDHQEVIKFLHDLGYSLLEVIRAAGSTWVWRGFSLNFFTQDFKEVYEYVYPSLRGLFTDEELSDYEIVKLAMEAFNIGFSDIRNQRDALAYLLGQPIKKEDYLRAMWEVWPGKDFYQFYDQILFITRNSAQFNPFILDVLGDELGFAGEKDIYFRFYDSSPTNRQQYNIRFLVLSGLTAAKLIEYFVVEKWDMGALDAWNFLWHDLGGIDFNFNMGQLTGAYNITNDEFIMAMAQDMKERGFSANRIYELIRIYPLGDNDYIQARILAEIHGMNPAQTYQFLVATGHFLNPLEIVRHTFNYSFDKDMLLQIVTDLKNQGLTASNIADYLYITMDMTKEEIKAALENNGFSQQQAQNAVDKLERLDIYNEEELLIFAMIWSLKQMGSSIHDISYYVAVQLRQNDPVLARNILLDNGYTESEILDNMYNVQSLLRFTEDDLELIRVVRAMRDRGWTAGEVAFYLYTETHLAHNYDNWPYYDNIYNIAYILKDAGYSMDEVLKAIEEPIGHYSHGIGNSRAILMQRIYLEIYPEVFLKDPVAFFLRLKKYNPNDIFNRYQQNMDYWANEAFPHLTLGDLHKLFYDYQIFTTPNHDGHVHYSMIMYYRHDDTVKAILRDVNMSFYDANSLLWDESFEDKVYWFDYNGYDFYTEYGPEIMNQTRQLTTESQRRQWVNLYKLFMDVYGYEHDQIIKMLSHWYKRMQFNHMPSAMEHLYLLGYRGVSDYVRYAPVIAGTVDYFYLMQSLVRFNWFGNESVPMSYGSMWSDYDIIIEVFRSGATIMDIARAISNSQDYLWMNFRDMYDGLRRIGEFTVEEARLQAGEGTSEISSVLPDILPLYVLREAGFPLEGMVKHIVGGGFSNNPGLRWGYKKAIEYLAVAGYPAGQVSSVVYAQSFYQLQIAMDITFEALKILRTIAFKAIQKLLPPPANMIFSATLLLAQLLGGDSVAPYLGTPTPSIPGVPSLPTLVPW